MAVSLVHRRVVQVPVVAGTIVELLYPQDMRKTEQLMVWSAPGDVRFHDTDIAPDGSPYVSTGPQRPIPLALVPVAWTAALGRRSVSLSCSASGTVQIEAVPVVATPVVDVDRREQEAEAIPVRAAIGCSR